MIPAREARPQACARRDRARRRRTRFSPAPRGRRARPASRRRWLSPASRSRAALDLKLIRSDPEGVKAALARRGVAAGIDELLELDERRRSLLPRIEELRG